MLRATRNIALVFVLAIFVYPSTALANWYWISIVSEPDTGYFIEEISPNTIGFTPTDVTGQSANKTLVPNGFMDTMDETKTSDKCSSELDSAIQRLRRFDANEEMVTPSVKCRFECSPYYANPEATMEAREELLKELESDARSCLVNEQKEIEEAAEEQARKEAEKAREAAIEKAVLNCDLDFFDTMTNKEKMDTYDEREACKAQSRAEDVEEVVDPEPAAVIAEPVPPTPLDETPIIPSAPVTQTQTISNPPATTEPVNEAETAPPVDIPEATTTKDSIEPEVVEPEKPNTLSESSEQSAKTKPEPRPSFFRRIVSFLTSWF